MTQENIMKNNKPGINFVIGAASGATIGALVALLFAPKSGKKLRRDISHKKDELIKDTGKFLRKAKHQAEDMIVDSKRKAESIIDDAKRKVENII